MRRWTAAAVAACACVGLLTGCWGAPSLDREGMVSILGIDHAPDGMLRITLDIVNATGLPPPTSSGGGGNTGGPVLIREATAPTVALAIARIADTSQMSIDLTHLQAVVVGESLARHGLGAALETVDRSREFTVTPWFLVTSGGTAHDLLRATREAPPQPGTALMETAQYSRQRSCCAAARLVDFVVQSAMQGYDFETAAVAAQSANTVGKEAGFRVSGTELFQGDRLMGMLPPPDGLGFLLLSAKVQNQVITVPSAFGRLSVELAPGRRSIRVQRTARGPSIDLELTSRGRLVAMPVAGEDLSRSSAANDMLETLTAHELLALAEAALRLMRAAHSDALGLGQEVRVQDPEDWRREGATWEDKGFPSVPVRIVVHFVLTEPGRTLCPLTRTCGPAVTPTS